MVVVAYCVIHSPFCVSVFEYDGLSGDGPFNLLVEENLLRHRAPHARTRPGHKSFRTLHKSKLRGPETSAEETNLLSRSQYDFIGAAGSEAADVSADVQSDVSEMETFELPFQFLPHPVDTSPPRTETMEAATRPPGNARDSQAAVTETSRPGSRHPVENRPKSSTAEPTNPIPNPTNDSAAITSVSPDAVHATATTIAATLTPKGPATSSTTLAATIKPQEESESSTYQVSTVPPSMQISTTTMPDTTAATSTPATAATAATQQAKQVKRTHRMSWAEEREALDEPMQRQDGPAERKPSESTSACVEGKRLVSGSTCRQMSALSLVLLSTC